MNPEFLIESFSKKIAIEIRVKKFKFFVHIYKRCQYKKNQCVIENNKKEAEQFLLY